MTAPDHVALHAWGYTPEGDQTYTDGGAGEPAIAGWCVYTFHEAPPEGGNIDASDEADFADYVPALAEANRRAAEYGVPVNEY